MTLNQLRSFVLAFRTGSFSGAARELGVAQASISELVKRLEEENGMALFIRSGRRLTLTTAGAELLPFAEQSVAAADAGAQAVRSLRWLSGGVATLGVLRTRTITCSRTWSRRSIRATPMCGCAWSGRTLLRWRRR